MKKMFVMAISIMILLGASVKSWAIPNIIHYQGRLTDTEGNDLNGMYEVCFRFYPDGIFGKSLWEETQTITVINGIFDTKIGPINDAFLTGVFGVFNHDTLYLEITITNPETGNQEILSPRQRIASVPFAIRSGESENAYSLDGLKASDFVKTEGGTMSQNASFESILQVTNSGGYGIGILGEATASNGTGIKGEASDNAKYGVMGYANNTGDIENYGGYFMAKGQKGKGVWGSASGLNGIGVVGNATNLLGGTGVYGKATGTYGKGISAEATGDEGKALSAKATGSKGIGVYTEASGESGRGVWGLVSGSDGIGVVGYATNEASGTGVYAKAFGSSGIGVKGYASDAGEVTNYGGSFGSEGKFGRGVHGWANGESGYGVQGSASGSNGIGVFGNATEEGNVTNYGGVFKAKGKYGRGVYAEVAGTEGRGVSAGAAGNKGIGVYAGASGESGRGVWGSASGSDGIGVVGYATNEASGTGVYAKAFGGSGIGVKGYASNASEVTNYGGNFGSEGKFGRGVYGWANGESGYGVQGFANGSNGIGVFGNATDDGNVTNYGGVFKAKGLQGIGISATGGPNGYAGKFHGNVRVYGAESRVITPVLEITGGADLSEHFEIKGIQGNSLPTPGMIVSIDPENPGHLVISQSEYDRKVAGIISGAGGIKPGMLMGQEDSEANGETAVALSGRVYCWADASYGSIIPGDLLTTSVTPGHAMKVKDYEKSHGAIIGKAMGSLDKGKGLILILVNLQ